MVTLCSHYHSHNVVVLLQSYCSRTVTVIMWLYYHSHHLVALPVQNDRNPVIHYSSDKSVIAACVLWRRELVEDRLTLFQLRRLNTKHRILTPSDTTC